MPGTGLQGELGRHRKTCRIQNNGIPGIFSHYLSPNLLRKMFPCSRSFNIHKKAMNDGD